MAAEGISVSVLGAGGVKTDFVPAVRARFEATAEKLQDNDVYKQHYERSLLKAFEATVESLPST